MDDDRSSTAHGGTIIIGLRELYSQIQQLDRTIAQLSAEVKMAAQTTAMQTTSIASQLADIRQDHSDHELRIRTLEKVRVVTPRSMWTAIGVLIPIVGLIVTIILATALN